MSGKVLLVSVILVKSVLSPGVTLFGGFFPPAQGLIPIFLDSHSIVIKNSEPDLPP